MVRTAISWALALAGAAAGILLALALALTSRPGPRLVKLLNLRLRQATLKSPVSLSVSTSGKRKWITNPTRQQTKVTSTGPDICCSVIVLCLFCWDWYATLVGDLTLRPTLRGLRAGEITIASRRKRGGQYRPPRHGKAE